MKLKKLLQGICHLLFLTLASTATYAKEVNIEMVNGHCDKGEAPQKILPTVSTLPSVAIIYVKNSSGDAGIWGTGTFIGRDTILTAGHAMFDLLIEESKGKHIYIIAGKNAPLQGKSYDIQSVNFAPGFNYDLIPDHDLAIIKTVQDYDGGIYPIKNPGTDVLDKYFGVVSYPAELIFESGRINQYVSRFKIDNLTTKKSSIAITNCFSYLGESGSGLFGIQQGELDGKIIGILSSGFGDHPGDQNSETYFTLLTGSDYDFVSGPQPKTEYSQILNKYKADKGDFNMCLGVIKSDDYLTLRPCTSTKNTSMSQWKFEKAASGYYLLKNKYATDTKKDKLCLRVMPNGDSIEMGTCAAGSGDSDTDAMRQWIVEEKGNYFLIKNKYKSDTGNDNQCLWVNDHQDLVAMRSCTAQGTNSDTDSMRYWKYSGEMN
ncbi:trypsin-like peptidase domain-containing protein [Enterobacter asburiae]